MVLTQHQARRHNHADVAAKDGSQETAVNLMALVAGLVLLPAVHGDPARVWTVFLLATVGHIYANYRAVKAVVMESFDEQRLELVALSVAGAAASGAQGLLAGVALDELRPAVIALRERLFYRAAPVRLGCRLAELDVSDADVAAWARDPQRLPFLVAPLRAHAGASQRGSVGVVLHTGVTRTGVIEAALAAHVFAHAMAASPSTARKAMLDRMGPPGAAAARLIAAGWQLDAFAYPVLPWRAE